MSCLLQAILNSLINIPGRSIVNYPDPVKMREDMKAFSNLNEARLYKLFRTCLDVDTDLKGLVKAQVSAHM